MTFSFASQYTFLVNKYDKEIELESQIMSNITSALKKDDIKLFIPRITDMERIIYSNSFKLVDACIDANFVFVKREFEIDSSCEDKIGNKLFFTNNYQKLLYTDKYIGAFFWNKSRPNIIFIKDRLVKQNIKLADDYEKFIEDIK